MREMEVVDGSFKKPGAIPFKWEVQPGVPKLKQCHHESQDSEPFDNNYRSCYSMPSTPHKLAPPPSSFGSCSTPTPDQLRSPSIRSLSRVRSDSFKNPGAMPFKWEVQPGVPKLKQCHHEPQDSEPFDNSFRSCYSMPSTPHKLAPPPPFRSTPDQLRSPSIRSLPRVRSDRFQYEPPLVTRSELVSTGCFLAPWLKWKWGKKRSISKSKTKSEHEPNYASEVDSVTRWSVSTRKSLSPWSDSPSSSSFSSHRSLPRPVGDAELAGIGFF